MNGMWCSGAPPPLKDGFLEADLGVRELERAGGRAGSGRRNSMCKDGVALWT